MAIDEDRIALAAFCGRKGEATRLILSQKDDISRWIEEGWPVVAIYRLLRSKGMATMGYDTFRKSLKRIFGHGKKRSPVENNSLQQEKQHGGQNNRLRPHEVQRQQSKQQFVTISGVDNIGLDKKE